MLEALSLIFGRENVSIHPAWPFKDGDNGALRHACRTLHHSPEHPPSLRARSLQAAPITPHNRFCIFRPPRLPLPLPPLPSSIGHYREADFMARARNGECIFIEVDCGFHFLRDLSGLAVRSTGKSSVKNDLFRATCEHAIVVAEVVTDPRDVLFDFDVDLLKDRLVEKLTVMQVRPPLNLFPHRPFHVPRLRQVLPKQPAFVDFPCPFAPPQIPIPHDDVPRLVWRQADGPTVGIVLTRFADRMTVLLPGGQVGMVYKNLRYSRDQVKQQDLETFRSGHSVLVQVRIAKSTLDLTPQQSICGRIVCITAFPTLINVWITSAMPSGMARHTPRSDP